MAQRTYTVAEANAMLPQVEALARTMRTCKLRIEVLRLQAARVAASLRGNGHSKEQRAAPPDAVTDAAVARVMDEMNAALARVHVLGCEVKDFDMGLIDFLHEREGRLVYLCWRLGEAEVAWWHEVHTGFGSRQPL